MNAEVRVGRSRPRKTAPTAARRVGFATHLVVCDRLPLYDDRDRVYRTESKKWDCVGGKSGSVEAPYDCMDIFPRCLVLALCQFSDES